MSCYNKAGRPLRENARSMPDETTSLMIIPHTNMFKCFGCGAEGGPVEFLMRIGNKSKTAVIGQLAEKTFPTKS